jgi:membrane protein YdbS with pleckstrin-like domain
VSYIRNTIGEHERLVILARFPWVLRAGSWLALLVLAVAPLCLALWDALGGPVNAGLQALCLVSAALGVGLFAWIQLYMWTTELGVTDQRLVIKRGLISRYTNEIPLMSLENVELMQPLLARLLGYGRLRIAGAGQTDLLTPPHQDPVTFRTALAEARTALSQPPSYRARPRLIDPLHDENKRPVLDGRGQEHQFEGERRDGVNARRAHPQPRGTGRPGGRKLR